MRFIKGSDKVSEIFEIYKVIWYLIMMDQVDIFSLLKIDGKNEL